MPGAIPGGFSAHDHHTGEKARAEMGLQSSGSHANRLGKESGGAELLYCERNDNLGGHKGAYQADPVTADDLEPHAADGYVPGQMVIRQVGFRGIAGEYFRYRLSVPLPKVLRRGMGLRA